MTFPPTTTIWPQVRGHYWKYDRRTAPIRLIIVHATRGDNTMALQYQATQNWQMSPDNQAKDIYGNLLNWGSMSTDIIGATGEHCITLPEDWFPTWSAGRMDLIAKSYELAQPTNNTPFTAACLERAAIEVAKDCIKHSIPPIVLPYVSGDNREAPGISRHDHSANGREWGKSDPGRMFDDHAFEERVRFHMAKQLDGKPAEGLDLGDGIRHNAVASWFSDRQLGPGPYDGKRDATWQLRRDLNLPPAARLVEVDVYLEPGTINAGITLYDGDTPDGAAWGFAGKVLMPAEHGTIVVKVGADGTCRARHDTPVVTATVGSLRYWT